MEKQIGNPGQAFSLGATWGTPSVDNAMTTEICDLINNTGVTLYTGDIVCLDPTGTMVNQYEWDGKSVRIDLSGLSEGMYFLKIRTPDRTEMKKLVVQ